jgi:hypothetical protein
MGLYKTLNYIGKCGNFKTADRMDELRTHDYRSGQKDSAARVVAG